MGITSNYDPIRIKVMTNAMTEISIEHLPGLLQEADAERAPLLQKVAAATAISCTTTQSGPRTTRRNPHRNPAARCPATTTETRDEAEDQPEQRDESTSITKTPVPQRL